MTLRKTLFLAAVSALWVWAGLAHGAEEDAVHGAALHARPTAAVPKDASHSAMAQRKKGPQVKLVDINSASKAALRKLPGMTDADVEKLIANRPYGSKMWLVTNNVLDAKTFGGIKGLVEARQPYKTAAENAALYQKAKN